MEASRKSRSPLRLTLELLEHRMLLHAGHGADHHAHVGDTHNEAAHLAGSLSGQSQQVIDLDKWGNFEGPLDAHLIDGLGADDAPVIFDEILGIPGLRNGGPESEVFPDFFPGVTGGFSLDQTTQPGRNLIRFGTQVNNQGSGPAILISGRPGIDPIPTGAPISSWVNPDGSQNVLQAIYSYSGSSFSLSRYVAAGRFTFHPGHGHFHFDGYANYRLRYSVGGQPGDYVMRNDGTDVIGEKVGFCLINISSSFVMENGQSSTTLPGYNAPGQPSTGCGLLQGIHVGKADVYSSSLSGQWLDVTGVPNGQYFLEMELDSEKAVFETNDDNNTKSFFFNLNVNPPAGGIPPDIFDSGGVNNNSFETATDMGVMGTFAQTGLTIHWGQDFDYFRFVASSSGQYTVTSTPASGDVNIFLYDADRNLIGSSTNPSGTDSISYNFVEGDSYYLKAEPYNSSVSSNYQVAWNLKPKTESYTSVGVATENGQVGKFVINRNGPTANPLTVNFALGGTAVNGVDYHFVPGSVSIGDLQSEAEIEIIPIDNGVPDGVRTVTLTIMSNNAYVVGTTGSQLIVTDVLGDFNFDGILDIADIDLLVHNVAIGPQDPTLFDLNGDGLVDQNDISQWLINAGALNLPSGNPYSAGDANLDGVVDALDFLIWNENKFQPIAAWSAGDFNADGLVDGLDFSIWNGNKFTSALRTTSVPLTAAFDFDQTDRSRTSLSGGMTTGRMPRAIDQIWADHDKKDELLPW